MGVVYQSPILYLFAVDDQLKNISFIETFHFQHYINFQGVSSVRVHGTDVGCIVILTFRIHNIRTTRRHN